jgi:hypothetical protein
VRRSGETDPDGIGTNRDFSTETAKRAPGGAVLADHDLARVVRAWPDLPEHVKAAVLALVTTGR